MIVRSGAVYLAVLMASLIVASLAMSAVTTAHYFARDLNEEADFRRAQLAADSALEWAVAKINSANDWRSVHTHNIDSSPQAFGDAVLKYRLLDTDGNLGDDPMDACDLLVTATVGNARYAWRATLEPAGSALSCLANAASAQQDIELQMFGVWSSDGRFASGSSVSVASFAALTADCATVGGSSGSIYGSLSSIAANDLQIPSASVLEPYVAVATAVNASLLPKLSGTIQIDKCSLSPAVNSISGEVNSSGIYFIDCGNSPITISNSRLQCTLVLKNVGSGCKVDGSLYWEAARPNYPALLVDGPLELALSRDPLKESSANVNFNPAGYPFRGVVDASKVTVYPSQIRGLVYCSGRIQLSSGLSQVDIFGGLVSGEKIRGMADLFVHYRDVYLQTPPPGFRSFSQVRLASGSVRRVETP